MNCNPENILILYAWTMHINCHPATRCTKVFIAEIFIVVSTFLTDQTACSNYVFLLFSQTQVFDNNIIIRVSNEMLN